MVATRSSNAPARPREEFFSHPSEEELLARHLLPRVSDDDTKQQPRASFIHEADVYALGPAELTNSFAPAVTTSGDRAWYFFSAVRAKSREGQRKARTVDSGEGCWHSEAGAKPVLVTDRRLGHRQSFSFVTKVDGRRVRSGWLMVELGIEGNDEMVLCKIYFSPRAHLLTGGGAARATPAAARKRKAASVEDDDDDKNKNPAAPVLQRRRTYLPPEAAAPPRANDDDTTGAGQKDEDTQGCSRGSSADFDHTGSFLSLLLDNREEFRAHGFVDRTDEQLRAQLGLQEFHGLLDGAAKKSEGLLQLPPYDADRNSGYPACLTHEDLYSTEPLWFENVRRGYSGLSRNGRRRR